MSELIREIKWGNIIGSKTNPDGWRIYASDFEFIMDFPDDYFPIPLSPEWLERFGFERDSENISWYILNGFGVSTNGSISLHIKTWTNTFPKKVECVHQLQNLYFALTGKELELKQ